MGIKSVGKKIVTNSNFLSMIRRQYNYYDACRFFERCNKAYRTSDYPEQLKKYKNTHIGQRCFIIGNGPSLIPEDLNKIEGEFSFAANRIWLMYDKTSWRPTFYMCQDWRMLQREAARIKEYPAPVFLGFDGMYKYDLQFDNAIAFLCDKRPCVKRQNPMPFSLECDQYVIDGTTVTYSSIQLAVYMGFSKIYLLGVDNSYQYTMDKNRKVTRDDSVKETYFDPKYKDIYDNAEQKKNASDPEMCNRIYLAAKEAAAKNKIQIYNATRGGKLEVFDRVDLDAVIGDGR